jgi:two-component system, NarL family, response regulator DegU
VSDLRQSPPVGLAHGSVQALLVDPHPFARIGLGVVLHRQPWIARCLLATDIDEATHLARRHRPDVAVVDVSEAGPFTSGYVAPLRTVRPTMPIVLSTLSAAPQPGRVDGLGRRQVITPEHSIDEVLAVISAALLGDDRREAARGERSEHGLSVREQEVLALLCTGATNREIAAALHVGPETIKKHARSLYRKLGARNRTEAARRAAELWAA